MPSFTRSSSERRPSSSPTTSRISSPHQEVDLHTGLLILPQTDRREGQWPPIDAALDYIEERAKAAGEPAADWMLNRQVEVDPDGAVKHGYLPRSE